MKTTPHTDGKIAAGHSYLMYFLKDSPELKLVFHLKWWHGEPYKLRTGGSLISSPLSKEPEPHQHN